MLKFNFKFLLFSLFSQLCKKHTKLVDQIRHAAVTGGQKQETESEDQDPEQDYVIIIINGVARTLKKLTHQRETTGSSNDSLQLCFFSNWELLLKERICSLREQILFFMSSFLYGKSLLSH